MKPTYKHLDDGTTYCYLTEKNGETTVGKARLHPEEPEPPKEFVGEYIATQRAEIKFYKKIIKNEIEPQLKTLKHLYSILISSNKYNSKNPEYYLIKRQYWMKKEDLEALKLLIKTLEEELKLYINLKKNIKVGQK